MHTRRISECNHRSDHAALYQVAQALRGRAKASRLAVDARAPTQAATTVGRGKTRSVTCRPRPPEAKRTNHLYTGATAHFIDAALHEIPVVSQIVGIIDGVLAFFGGADGGANGAKVRAMLDQEADRFTGKFRELICEVTHVDDLEALAKHINHAAASVTDGLSLQRIALRLQATMAEKAMQLTHAAKARVGAEMKAAVEALQQRKTEHLAAGKLAVGEAMRAGEDNLNDLALQSRKAIDDRAKSAAEVGNFIAGYIAELDTLRSTVLEAAQKNTDALGDIAATARSAEFSKRNSSVSVRSTPKATRTTRVARPGTSRKEAP